MILAQREVRYAHCTYVVHTYYVPSANWSYAIGKEYAYHGEIDIGGVELHVDLLVDQSLALLLEVLSDTGSHFKVLNVWSCVRMFAKVDCRLVPSLEQLESVNQLV